MGYVVKVVDQAGSSFGTVTNAEINRPPASELNAAGSVEIGLPTTDPDGALLVPGREVQIYADGVTNPVFWGPIVRIQAGLNRRTWQCAGLLWYFTRRFMGRADRVNQLTNGDFEAGETGWSFSGVTHSIDTTPPAGGPGGDALKLTGAAADHDTYAYQIFTHGPGGYPTGDYLTASAWVNIPSADYLAPAKEDRALMLIHKDPSGNVVDVQAVTVNDDTPKDTWGPDGVSLPLETGVGNVKENHTVEVRLYPPHGVAYFDLVTLTFMESLGAPSSEIPSSDVTDIIGGIVDYAQDRFAFDHGKSDLNIGHGGAPTGVNRRVWYQFEQHRNIFDAIMEFVRDGICDISIELTPTTRTFMVWPGRKGSLYGTTLELDVNVADFDWSEDLEQGASTVVLIGPGDGPDRPEGGATDASFTGGAFTAEIVEQAPDDTTIGQLDIRAEERLKVAARPEIFTVTTLPGSGVIGNLAEGDTVHVVIPVGSVDIDDTYRVVRIEADLDTDQARLTLNAEA